MRVISVIEAGEVIKKIIEHSGLWEVKARPARHLTLINCQFNVMHCFLPLTAWCSLEIVKPNEVIKLSK